MWSADSISTHRHIDTESVFSLWRGFRSHVLPCPSGMRWRIARKDDRNACVVSLKEEDPRMG